ncbi:MAG TPA: Gfo/Idh/MocA family oxidoreductase [Armatimonadota bacterium]|nr:Gfo/Idh/MocA family oxidoreductase [Armatimonadota bacterium]
MTMPEFPITIAILGAGGRGNSLSRLINGVQNHAKVVAVAEPHDDYRASFTRDYAIPAEQVFTTWQEFVVQPKMCDAVVVSTMDRDHVGPAVACLDKGYHVLLEKPMATTLDDCQAIEAAQRRSGKMVAVCHSLRYQKGFHKVKELIDAGRIGQVISIDQLEQVAYWHQAHSFVRGNWGNEGRSTFMLLAKSCHDIDYIAFLTGKPCLRVNSFGHLTYFTKEHAPAGSTARCTDGCTAESTCTYSAIKRYVNTDRTVWPACVASHDHSEAAHLEAIKTGPYGKCVFRTDNDVVDHQVVTLEFADDITATFTMTAFTKEGGRLVRVHGTDGEIAFHDAQQTVTVKTFADENVETIVLGSDGVDGHGGGDRRVVDSWLRAIHTGNSSLILTSAQESLRTHTIVFAAECSRREHRTVDMAELYAPAESNA